MLGHLGIRVKNNSGVLEAEIPSWRLDLKQEIDLIEELAKLKGYENVPVGVMPVTPDINEGKKEKTVTEILRERLVGMGFYEAINISFSEDSELKKLGLTSTYRIANPLSKENEFLRPSLLPGLYKNLKLNIAQGFGDIRFFETGTVFTEKAENKMLGIIVTGHSLPQWAGWKNENLPPLYDFYFLSGTVQSLLSGNAYTVKANEKPASYYHPGKSAVIEIGGKKVAEFGILKPEYSSDVNGTEIGYADIDIALLEKIWNRSIPEYEPVRRHPPVKRYLSIVADKTVPFDSIMTKLGGVSFGGKLSVEIELTDIYEDSQKLGESKRSYTLHLTFRHIDHTLTDTEINEQVQRIVTHLNRELGITLR